MGRASKGKERFLEEGKKHIPLGKDLRLVQAGARGYVLVGAKDAIAVLQSNGRSTPVRGMPTAGWRAARARADGFEVALVRETPEPAAIELWFISFQGKARRVGAFTGSELVQLGADMALGPDQTLYAASKTAVFWNNDEGILELTLGKKPPRLAWSKREEWMGLGFVISQPRKY